MWKFVVVVHHHQVHRVEAHRDPHPQDKLPRDQPQDCQIDPHPQSSAGPAHLPPVKFRWLVKSVSFVSQCPDESERDMSHWIYFTCSCCSTEADRCADDAGHVDGAEHVGSKPASRRRSPTPTHPQVSSKSLRKPA